MYLVFMNLTQFWTWFQIEHWAAVHLLDTASCWSQMWWELQQGIWLVPDTAAAGFQESGSGVVLWGSMRTLVSRICRSCKHSSALCSIRMWPGLWGLSQSSSWPVSVNAAQERMWDCRSFLVCGLNYASLAGIKTFIHNWEERSKIQEKVRAEVRI